MSEDIFLSVVIPSYNEEKRIAKTLDAVIAYLESKPFVSEIIVSDDGSTDRTDEIVNGYIDENKFPRMKNVGYGDNHGKGYAVKYGIVRAKGKNIIFTDADNATPIEEADKLLAALEEADVAICSRHMKGSEIVNPQPWFRRFAGGVARLLIRAAILPGIKDTQCGFKGFRKDAATLIFPKQTIWGWGFDMEVLVIARKNKLKVREVPSIWHHRGASKINFFRDFFSTLRDLFRIISNRWKGKYDG